MIRLLRLWISGIAALGVAAHVTAFAQPQVTATVARAPVTWILFVDDLHLDFRNTGRIRNTITTIATELIQSGDRFAVASSGPSAIAVDVTTERQSLDAAIKKTVGNGLRYDDLIQANGAAEMRYRASIAAATAQSMLSNVSRLPAGPIAVVYISNGYSAEVHDQLTELTATAARSAIRVFAIDPRVAFDDPVPDLTDPARRLAMRMALLSMSEATGGVAIVDGDFATQLRRVAVAMRQ